MNSRIQPGRYFADPQRTGCYWERQSGLGGTLSEIIANDVFSYDPRQVIVDILRSDLAFMGDADCGSWYTTPRQPAQVSIPPGMWLVGDQLQPGTYQATVGADCYWERLRNFEGVVRSIISNDFIAAAGPHLVTISSGDVGFNNDGDCGTWTRAMSVSVTETSVRSGSEISRAWRLNRAKKALATSAP